MDNVELFQYLHETPGHYSDYSSLYLYLAKHPSMYDYYWEMFKNIDLDEKMFLELGPGVGEALDVARDMGALTFFIDRDIFIYKYCINKGHQGRSLDFFTKPLPDIGTYDFILSRGSLNVDMMNETWFDIYYLLDWILRAGKHIIIIPTWNKGEMVEGNDYTCVGEHMESYLQSRVHNCFLCKGFEMKTIEGVNDRLRFPITYEYISPL